MRTSLTIALITALSIQIFAQSKKDLKKYNIKSVSELTTRTTDSGEISYKDCYQRFDNNGNTIEEINYRKDGTIKERNIRKFDSSNNLLSEEEQDATGKLKKKQVYQYNMEGDRIGETEYDEFNKLSKKTVILYNNKGFKMEKQIYDGNLKLITIKKYEYTN
jgi:hypothetical protein